MSGLRIAQSLHVRYTGMLIAEAYRQGYELTWGETLRTMTEAQANAESGAGIANSLHTIKLAVDFALFKDDVELTTVDDFLPLGEYWKSLDVNNCWGGDFKAANGEPKPDADHFSYTWDGVK
jgi:hypothetical protein